MYKILQWVLVKTENDSLSWYRQIKTLEFIDNEEFSVSMYSLIKKAVL